jgi:hypothetical protein
MTLSFQASYASSDTLAPAIQNFSLNASSFDPSQPGGAYLSASLQFSDNLAGFDYGSISFRSSSSGQTRSLSFNRSNLQGSSLAGTLYASRKLDPFTAAGSWSLDSIQLGDKAGNSFYKSSYSTGQLHCRQTLKGAPVIHLEFKLLIANNKKLLEYKHLEKDLRWVPFIGQIWPLTSLTPGGRNRVRSQCRPHGEFCLPGSCGALHGSTSIGSGRG